MQKKVLIVDDEESSLKILQHFLKEDYITLTATNADDALTKIRLEKPSTVVTDIKMPGKDGIELLRNVVEIDPDLPIILITAHGDKTVAISALKLGAFDFLEKPVDKDELGHSVSRAIRYHNILQERKDFLDKIKYGAVELLKMTAEINELRKKLGEEGPQKS